MIPEALVSLIADATGKHYSVNVSRTAETCNCGAVFEPPAVVRQWDEHWARVALAVISDRYELTPINPSGVSIADALGMPEVDALDVMSEAEASELEAMVSRPIDLADYVDAPRPGGDQEADR